MKTLYLFLSFCVPVLVVAQTPSDSTFIQQVDSLIQVSKTRVNEKDFDKALEANAAAEKIALEKLGRETAAYGNVCFNHGWVLYKKKDYAEAEKWYLEARSLLEKAIGKEHPDYAVCLTNLALIYGYVVSPRDYEKAVALYLEAIAIQKKFPGSAGDITYAASLSNLAYIYNITYKYADAEPLYLEALAIQEKVLGKENMTYAGNLINLAVLYDNLGNYQQAVLSYLEAKSVIEKLTDTKSLNFAWLLNSIGNSYRENGDFEKAESFYVEAKTIRENKVGKKHPEYARSLTNLAILYRETGNYEKAELYHLECIEILAETLGKEHIEYARSLENLAIVYAETSNYEKAEPLYLEAKTIYENLPEKENPSFIGNQNNLAILYWQKGDFEKAELYYLEAIALQEKVVGKENPSYAKYLYNLASVYKDMHNYEKAERLLLEAKSIQKNVMGPEHADYSASLQSLGGLYYEMDNYEKAESFFLESKAIREKVFGKNHYMYATTIKSLGSVYVETGNYEKAESHYLEAMAIEGNSLGTASADYLLTQFNLALVYKRMGKYEKAIPLYLETIAAQEKVLGKEHPDYATSLKDLGIIYEIQNKFGESEALMKTYFGLNQSRLSKATAFLSERELAQYTSTFQSAGNRLASFLLSRQLKGVQTGALPGLAYDHALFLKGFLLSAANRLNLLAASAPEAAALSQQLKGYRRYLAAELTKPIADRKAVEVFEEKANATEKELSRLIAGYSNAHRQITWKEVQSMLKKSEAAIEFVRFDVKFPQTTDSTMYAAILLLPGAEQPIFKSLFEEKQLTKILSTGVSTQQPKVFAQIYSRGVEPLNTKNLTGLYNLIWKPLDSLLSGVHNIWYAPSGVLHRINFDAIPIDNTQNLSDRYTLTRLGSTRSLVVPDLPKSNENNEALVFGGITYEIDPTDVAQDSMIQAGPEDLSSPMNFVYADRSVPQRGERWNYLPGTEKEGSRITALLKKSNITPHFYSGKAATEETFKTIGKSGPSPRILHIATHGFFFPDPGLSPALEKHQDEADASLRENRGAAFKISDHPMIRSGLILAGGNHAWQTGKPYQPGMEDGILTAFEISQMNLSGTELVVLSACETGLGDIQGNEGVYGLQRAFKIAGVKYLVMSLWQVPDEQTQELMTTFYTKWLEDGFAIPEAFIVAQKEMQKKHKDPYLWAGFVLVE